MGLSRSPQRRDVSPVSLPSVPPVLFSYWLSHPPRNSILLVLLQYHGESWARPTRIAADTVLERVLLTVCCHLVPTLNGVP